MASTGRIPLWLIATIGGTAALTVVGLFIFGSYSGVGSSLSFFMLFRLALYI